MTIFFYAHSTLVHVCDRVGCADKRGFHPGSGHRAQLCCARRLRWQVAVSAFAPGAPTRASRALANRFTVQLFYEYLHRTVFPFTYSPRKLYPTPSASGLRAFIAVAISCKDPGRSSPRSHDPRIHLSFLARKCCMPIFPHPLCSASNWSHREDNDASAVRSATPAGPRSGVEPMCATGGGRGKQWEQESEPKSDVCTQGSKTDCTAVNVTATAGSPTALQRTYSTSICRMHDPCV